MRLLLVRKLAPLLDGIDVSDADEGDVLDLPRTDADLLIAEGWALPFRGPARAEYAAYVIEEAPRKAVQAYAVKAMSIPSIRKVLLSKELRLAD